MQLNFERELVVESSCDEIRDRLLQWAGMNGYTCIRDLRGQWQFTRGSGLGPVLSTDIKRVPTEVNVRFDSTQKLVCASVVASSPLARGGEAEARQLGSEVDVLVACLRGVHDASGGAECVEAVSNRGPSLATSGAAPRLDAATPNHQKPVAKSSHAVFWWLAGVAAVFLLSAGVAVGLTLVVAPELLRVPGVQTPVNLTVRQGVLTPNVLRIQSLSRDPLKNVVVTARRPSTGDQESRRFASVSPGQLVELGGLEWNWIIVDGDSVTVDADGFVPVVFTSSQLFAK